jgi:hypothetical protein
LNKRKIGVIRGVLGVDANFITPFILIDNEEGYSIKSLDCEILTKDEMLEAFEIATNLIKSDYARKTS